ncbi:MAG: sigma 54-interacting transcriptional regulator, partial [Myxococcota bacterium]
VAAGLPATLVKCRGSADDGIETLERQRLGLVALDVLQRLAQTAVMLYLVEEERAPEAGESNSFGSLVGTAPAMRRLFTLIDRVARSDAAVLIHGPTGTGKELVSLPEAGQTDRAHSQRSTELDTGDADTSTTNAGLSCEKDNPTAPVTLTSRPFIQAKAKVVADFERGYLGQLMAEHNSLHAAAQAAGMDRIHLRILRRRHGMRD